MDNYKLDIENVAHNCEYCGYDNLEYQAELYNDNKLIWRSDTYYYPSDEEINEFRKEIETKLKELGIERDLSDNCPYYWSDD